MAAERIFEVMSYNRQLERRQYATNIFLCGNSCCWCECVHGSI